MVSFCRTKVTQYKKYYFFISITISMSWSALGLLVAIFNGNFHNFLDEWIRLQGFPLVALGLWLYLVGESNPASQLLARLVGAREARIEFKQRQWQIKAKRIIIILIGSVGSISLISLGFSGQNGTLAFMWCTCIIVCFLAGYATWHGVNLILVSSIIEDKRIKVFVYSPAETKELKKLAIHVTKYATILTVGYAFALFATLLGQWTGNSAFIRVVVIFWPGLYVPFCFVLLIYPQLKFSAIVKKEKSHILMKCQKNMNDILNKEDSLSKDEVERCNMLAELFEKVSATPNNIMNFGIMARTVCVATFNLASIIMPKELIIQLLKDNLRYISP